MINVQNLPPDITASARGVLWNREVRDGKPTKVPYQAHHPAEPITEERIEAAATARGLTS